MAISVRFPVPETMADGRPSDGGDRDNSPEEMAWEKAAITTTENVEDYLNSLVAHFEHEDFIADDPIAIPRGFDDPRDQEVIGLYSAILAWGSRATVLKKMEELCERMHYRPYHFVLNFGTSRNAAQLDTFKHRTFQPQDAFWFTKNLSRLLQSHGTVEAIFARHLHPGAPDVENESIQFIGEFIG